VKVFYLCYFVLVCQLITECEQYIMRSVEEMSHQLLVVSYCIMQYIYTTLGRIILESKTHRLRRGFVAVEVSYTYWSTDKVVVSVDRPYS